MPIQLDKILADIAEEKPLHPHNAASKIKKDHDDAWIRVAKKNKLSAHEAKSIFKVLQKKYEQENLKPASTWKLFQQMEEICRKEDEVKPKMEPEPVEMEEESFVEFLEVREEDEDYEGESDNQDKSMKSNSSMGSPDKDSTGHLEVKPEHKLLNTQMMIPQATTPVRPEYTGANQQQQQLKQQQSNQMSAAFTNALQKKGISMRKTSSPALDSPTSLNDPLKRKVQAVEKREEPARSMLLPEGLKRKLQGIDKREEPRQQSVLLTEGMKRKLQSMEKRDEAVPTKKSFITVGNLAQQQASSSVNAPIPPVEIKQEIVDDLETSLNSPSEAINVITIPSNPPTVSTDLSNGITTIKTNGFNTRIEDIDFQKDIIFDSNPTGANKQAGEIINIGNFENQLPPTFFKNLCNSQRHEALGLYVANVMNRVHGKAAAKLELNILKAIIEAQSDELARL